MRKIHPTESKIGRLYSREYDFPAQPEKASDQRYLIATNPRTGSTMLSVKLYKHIGFGLPLEYLNIDQLEVRLTSTNTKSFSEYWDHIQSSRKDPSSGIFGVKCFAMQANMVRLNYPAVFEKFFLRAKIVRLIRRDIVAQAVSLVRANQTNRWFADQAEAQEALYDHRAISRAITFIENQNSWWERIFFGKSEITTIYYEDLVSDPSTVIAQVQRLLNLRALTVRQCNVSDVLSQRDPTSAAWADRFTRERDQAAAR